MDYKLDSKFCLRIKGLSWAEIREGLSKGWLTHDVAINRALQSLEGDQYQEDEAELASMSADDQFDVENLVSRLAGPDAKADSNRWLLIVMAWLWENKDSIADPLLAIEEIYADFDYPENISHLVRYMPYDGPPRNLLEDLGSFVKQSIYGSLVQKP